MILSVEWVHSTRSSDEKLRFELIGRNSILDFFGGVENAKKAYEFYQKNPHRPFQDWPHAYHHAFRRAASNFTAWEKTHTQFRVTFNEGLKNGD
jgi:hypothetical protein